MTLADGTQVEARLVGDEFCHYYLTRQQQVMRLNSQQRLEASAVPQRALRRTAEAVRPRIVSTEQFRGQRRQLVILAEFADRKMIDHSTTAFWNNLFNQPGFTGHGDYHDPQSPYANVDVAYGSIHDYFFAQSNGFFDVQFDVYRAQLSHNYAYYGANTSSGDDVRPGQLVSEAVSSIASNIADWSVYDWNGDGEVNQVMVIFAGRGENDTHQTPDPNAVWPHQWRLTSAGVPALCFGDQSVNTYCLTSELDGTYEYGSFGTICHEYSHCFGLPDFYNTTMGYSVLGEWDVLDKGSYAGNGFRPVGYSSFERQSMGWFLPGILVGYNILTGIPAMSESPTAFMVFNDGDSNEYYLIENRQPTGWDRYLPGSGVLITHVNYDPSAWEANKVNTSSRKNLHVVAANNSTFLLSGWAYPYGKNDSLTNESVPAATLFWANLDGSHLLNHPITNIKVEHGLASFTFDRDASTGIPAVVWRGGEPPEGPIYDLRGRRQTAEWSALPRGIYLTGGLKIYKP